MEKNLYRATANFYDLDQRNVVQDDIPFYIERAKKNQGDVLELACGTGRVLLPMAQAGINVWGLDLSIEMLDQLNQKKSILDQDAKDRIHTIHGDMSNFDVERKFSLIIIPFRGFQALTTDEQQHSSLQMIYHHLADDGQFIIDVFRPYGQLDVSWVVQGEMEDWTYSDPKTGINVKRTNKRTKIDVEKQIIYPELIYYITDQNGKEERIVESLALKYYYEEQMRELLLSNGFEIVEEMGYYDGRSIKDGPELIFVCKKA